MSGIKSDPFLYCFFVGAPEPCILAEACVKGRRGMRRFGITRFLAKDRWLHVL
jgi:hypothetical protein